MSSKSVLATGGAGFIGSHPVRRLIELDYRVLVFDDNLSTGRLELLPLPNDKLQFAKGDITNGTALTNTLREFKPDYSNSCSCHSLHSLL